MRSNPLRLPNVDPASAAGAPSARGFSLLEMMLVLLIMSTLVTIVIVNLTGRGEKAKEEVTKVKMKQIEDAITDFRFNNGVYPTLDQGLQVLVTTKSLKKIPKDGWGRDFYYYVIEADPDRPFEIISLGSDGQPGTADDISNWRIE